MDSGTATVVGVVIGAVLGALFQVVAGALDARRARRVANLERREAAYVALIDAYDAHRKPMNDLQFALVTKQSAPAGVSRALDAIGRSYGPLSQALARVEFFGSRRVAAAARELSRASGRFANTSLGDASHGRRSDEFRLAFYELMAAMRADLEMPTSAWHSERLDELQDSLRQRAEREVPTSSSLPGDDVDGGPGRDGETGADRECD